MISLRSPLVRNVALGGLFLAGLAVGTTLFFLSVAEASGGGAQKIKICHIPQGNPENAQTIEVDKNSVTHQAHLAHGDAEGSCETKVTIVATKIVCDAESKLPNWGLGGPDITASTASDYVATHPGCRLEPNWKFQWGYGAKSGQTGVRDLSGDFVGEADGSMGQGTDTGTGYSDWKTFGPTNASGTAHALIGNLNGATRLWVREVLEDGYVPFTFYPGHATNADNVSAELYCHTDVLNYDNYDFVNQPELGRTYYCVAFNALKTDTPPPPPPVDPSLCPFVASDDEQIINFGISKKIVSWGSHNDAYVMKSVVVPPGTYEVMLYSYDSYPTRVNSIQPREEWYLRLLDAHTALLAASDPIGDLADSVETATKTAHVGNVTLSATATAAMAKHAAWPDTSSANSLYPVCAKLKKISPPLPANQKPVITLLGALLVTVTQGSSWTDPGAMVHDNEDGDITHKLVIGGTVDTNTLGTYTITYNATDTQGLPADEKTRTVTVVPAPQCSDGISNDGDALIDFPDDPGCATPEDDDENEKPVITVLGDLAMLLTVHSAWTDPGAMVHDNEDGDITHKLVIGGTVDTNTLGTYTITYNATDTQGLPADEKTRTVRVTAACSDGIDNDNDGMTDFPDDAGCGNPEDNDENEKPVITLLGSNPLELVLGSSFTDPGADAHDAEDCIGKTQEECNIALNLSASGSVDTDTVGVYTVTYTAEDSAHVAADPVVRTVMVNPPMTECADDLDNDSDGKTDYPDDLGCAGPEDNNENEAPVITLRGDNPIFVRVHTAYVEPSADVNDPEEGDIDGALVIGGDTVDTETIGTYVVTYNASDSMGAAASQRTRTVKVVTACSDGIDNDDDGKTDYPDDFGCTDPDDDTEEDPANQKPVITLLGALLVTVTQGSSWTDPGAMVHDNEDGDITHKLVIGGTVDTNTLGTYTITYNATDTQGLSADEKTRTVTVVSGGGGGGSVPPQCADGGDNDGDAKSDYPADPGCESSLDNDETDTPLPPPGGGGGGGTPTLVIMNERLESTGDNSVLVTWNTNLPATSRVVYGLDPVPTPGTAPLYGYGISTATSTAATTSHAVSIDGIPSGASTYFRPVSTADAQTAIGIELTRGAVLGATTDECFYIREYLRLGANNNPVEVTKLQTFLRDFEGFSALAVTGFFDIETDRAVRIFQDRYATDVLTPWNLPGNTGYVYYTTQKKINEIYCARAFPLSDAQLAEIAAFRSLMEKTAHDGSAPRLEGGTLGSGKAHPSSVNEALAQKPRTETGVTGTISASVPGTLTAPGQKIGSEASKEEKETRLTIADILATVPNVGKKLSTGTMPAAESVRGDGNTAAGTRPDNELAAVGGGVLGHFGLARPGVYVIVLFLLLAVVAGGIALRRTEKRTVTEGSDTTSSLVASSQKDAPSSVTPPSREV